MKLTAIRTSAVCGGLFSLTLLTSQCSSTSEGSSIGVRDGAVSPCEGLLECGGACSTDQDCGSGLFCENAACTAQCTAGGGQCTDASVCDGDGRCIAKSGTNNGGELPNFNLNTNGAGGSEGEACIEVKVEFERLTPSVILLIDKSGSMLDDFGGQNRWETVGDTLFDPNTGIIAPLAPQVRFGLALYTSLGGNAGGECPMLDEVPIAIDNFAAISAAYSGAVVADNGDTPTAESVAAVTQTLAAYQEIGPKSIILATDGNPDNCQDPDAHNAASQAGSVREVEAAYAEGITTYVVSVGDEVALDHLQDLANAGAGVDNGATYYQALNADQLAQAFENIVGGITNCIFNLNGRVEEGAAGQGSVSLNGTQLGFEDPNGWRLSSPEAIELLGSACEAVKAGAGDTLDITFPCGVITIIR